MNKAVTFCGDGIKCANPKCNYVDTTVSVDDYKDWLNRPCPKCGANLLTQVDYDNVQTLNKATNLVSKIFIPKNRSKEDEKTVKATFHFDGSGKMDVEVED